MQNSEYKQIYVETLQALVLAADASEKSSSGYADKITSPELKAMVMEGAKIAQEQAGTIKDLLRKADGQPGREPNRIIEGIIATGKQSVDSLSDPMAKDAAIVATLQVALHYYIAAYGTLVSTAKHLGLSDEAQIIASMNDWMKGKDAGYTKLIENIKD